jgi:hypothetical protein
MVPDLLMSITTLSHHVAGDSPLYAFLYALVMLMLFKDKLWAALRLLIYTLLASGTLLLWKCVMELYQQIIWLLLLAVPIACVAWTVTHEEVFREPREYCVDKSKNSKTVAQRKFFYLFTCEYCFSHYVTILFLIITRFHLLFTDWRGYLIAGFSLVWIANVYMSLFGLIRQDIVKEKEQIKMMKEQENNIPPSDKL